MILRHWRHRSELVCRQAVALVSDYVDGQLSDRDRARLEHHLAGCAHCTEYLAQVRRTIEALGRAEPEDLSDEEVDEFVDLYRRWSTD
jgi:anti-sigma factor RsiW